MLTWRPPMEPFKMLRRLRVRHAIRATILFAIATVLVVSIPNGYSADDKESISGDKLNRKVAGYESSETDFLKAFQGVASTLTCLLGLRSTPNLRLLRSMQTSAVAR